MFEHVPGVPIPGVPLELGPHALSLPFLFAGMVCGLFATHMTTGGRSWREAGKGLYGLTWIFTILAGVRPA